MKFSLNRLQWVCLGVICMLLGALLVLRTETKWTTRSDEGSVALLRQVLDIVGKSYVDKVERKKLIEGAVSGMLESLDPHSAYMPPESFREMQISTSGAFGGVGIEITMREGKLTVISPIDETPASRAGIRAGDVIARIDGKLTRGLSISQAVGRMRGPAGTPVTLSVLRQGVDRPLEFPLLRAIIKVQ
ncbi:MAG TPA: PDZ domain-containing protein, partial [Verrucomicrobiae bacterium]|nr:PDZ domain-containing protein [Verrucomicrobiae bacterium]